MIKPLFIVSLAIVLAACQATPQVSELQNQNASLEKELAGAKQRIAQLQKQENALQGQVQELEQLASVLTNEKTSRVQESSELRAQVRRFVQQQIDDLKAFLVKGELLDYVGSALVERSQTEDKPLTLVDLAHPMPRAGSLTGVTGEFTAPTDVQLKVMRPVEDGFVVIWESSLLAVPAAGVTTVPLPVSVGVEPGDVVAYVFPEAPAVSFDRGTGDTRYTTKDLALGDMIRASSLSGEKQKRAYSLGVYAILD